MLLAAAAPHADVGATLLAVAAALAAAKLLGEVAERVGQPAVLGELIAGLLVGPSLLGLVDPDNPTFRILAEIGVVLLLFQIGLETELRKLAAVGGTALTVAVVGVVLPFALGDVVARVTGVDPLAALVMGAALTATSVGITARVFADLGCLRTAEAQVVLGAAVIDDVIGLIILAVVDGIVRGSGLTAGGVLRTTGVALAFVAGALVIGRLVVPPLFRLLARIGRESSLAPMALALMFFVAVLAQQAGLALIVGAFAAGLVLAPTPQAPAVERGVAHLGHFFVPIFFVAVGAQVDVHSYARGSVLALGGLLVLVAIVSKVLAGFAPVWFPGRKLVVGVGMIPRGEVGLIFAQMGRTSGVLDAGLFAALTLMIMVTTFVTPPLLKPLAARLPRGPGDARGTAELVTEA